MRVLMRCDASAGGGVGHLVRCLALADAARRRGWDVVLSGALDVGLARRLVDRADLRVVPGVTDAAGLAQAASGVGADVVHVDDYALGTDLRDHLRPAGLALSSMEDGRFGRRPADLVVDPTLGAESAGRPDDGSAEVLLGVRYAPLRESVHVAREVFAARVGGEEPAVLVVLGGTDASGASPAVVALCASLDVPLAKVTVVSPSQSRGAVHEASDGLPVEIVGPQDDLPALAATHDVVLSAAGTTVWELACVGVPTGLVAVVENQRTGYERAVAAGVAVGLGSLDDVRHRSPGAQAALRRLLTDEHQRRTLSTTGRALVDGEGARRVVEGWERAAGATLTMAARRARSDDAPLLLAWRNDPVTRAASRSTAEVDPAEHEAWLHRVLADPGRMLLVVEDRGEPVGTVRFDREEPGLWEVSVTVAPEVRGRGLAHRVLAVGEAAWRREVGTGPRVLASVRPDNTASARLFRSAGYRPAPERATPAVEAYVKD
jgi:spore coat polysaccharide biosynthesis predicted glycosyltransferase SpsG/RimJ/RimL family protein N-acetyltransferase